ncbi:pyridoxamine 5'-phosphate oxidase family protein, partial [Acinetobacter baumannii]
RFGPQEQAFIAECNSFYLATVSETGWPYVQHRGGPRGFLHAVDDATLAFLDYRGNRQYISTGNLLANNRACVIIVDYRRRARLKIYGHVDT